MGGKMDNNIKVEKVVKSARAGRNTNARNTKPRREFWQGNYAVAQGALAWLWGHSPATIPIPGFKGTQQAEENARAMTFGPLTQEHMAQIDLLFHE